MASEISFERAMQEKDLALTPASVVHVSLALYEEKYKQRIWQGIPGIEKSARGRLWATFYSGGKEEGPDNYVAVVTSDDEGSTWSNISYVVDPPGQIRAYDPCLWFDPQGKLWLFWAQSYGWYDGRCGVFAAVCENSDAEEPVWSEPRRIADGIMMNKPTVLRNGEWHLPTAVWACEQSALNDLPEERYSNVYRSIDQGITFHKLGSADIPERCFDEHMIVERKDGSLWMLVRTHYGIGESISLDGGTTWTPGARTSIEGPNSRFFIRRLQSGRLLLVNHYKFTGRSHLTARLSDDDGITWYGELVLDERRRISYPDGLQDHDGFIYIIYDRERHRDREVLMAKFTEQDIEASRIVHQQSRLKCLVNQSEWYSNLT